MGETVLECARRLGIDLVSLCGGKGRCRSCKVRCQDGRLPKPTPEEVACFTPEELGNGWRLACRTCPLSDCRFIVPMESITLEQRLQIEGAEVDLKDLDPPVHSFDCALEPPSIQRPVSDADNLSDALDDNAPDSFDLFVLKELPAVLRRCDWHVRSTLREGELICVDAMNTPTLGLAVDLGTTKIAGYLLDLETGKRLSAKGVLNPQISRGEDIIARIHEASHSQEEPGRMAEMARDALMSLAKDLCAEAGISPRNIMETVIVGNTAMHHLILGLPVGSLAQSPFVPAVRGELLIKARDMGLDFAPGSFVYFPPNIAGFVGSDHTAALVAIVEECTKETSILLDIGTNTEISLISEERILCVSCASGPAFEGYHIQHGVRATAGAIEKISIDRASVVFRTIGDVAPIGICGSGILDAVSQLYRAGVLEKGGRIRERSHPRVTRKGDRLEFLLVREGEKGGCPEITVTQKDIREVQLGKAAIRAALSVLLKHASVPETSIRKVFIGGAFGSYIDVPNAIGIGLLPKLPLDRFHQVGNAAGRGAVSLLVSSTRRKKVREMLERATYLELAAMPEFNASFIHACGLDPYEHDPGLSDPGNAVEEVASC